jgi:ribA/ribD-fused uncharacterized protein
LLRAMLKGSGRGLERGRPLGLFNREDYVRLEGEEFADLAEDVITRAERACAEGGRTHLPLRFRRRLAGGTGSGVGFMTEPDAVQPVRRVDMDAGEVAVHARSAAELSERVRGGEKPGFLFFWEHRASAEGVAGKECLSQWWPQLPFAVNGVGYYTAGHFMMVSKAALFGDTDTAERIRHTPDPATAKALGRTVAGFDEQLWVRYRYEIVVMGNIAKFKQYRTLGSFLTGTGDQVLVEASPSVRRGLAQSA